MHKSSISSVEIATGMFKSHLTWPYLTQMKSPPYLPFYRHAIPSELLFAY